MLMVSGLTLARRSSWTADQTRVRGRRMPSSSMEWPNPGGGLLMGGGVRAGVGLLHACLSACWPTALVLPLCPLPLPCVSSGLLVLPVAVCTARSCQHRLLVKLVAGGRGAGDAGAGWSAGAGLWGGLDAGGVQAGSGAEEVWAEPGEGGVRDVAARGMDPGGALGRDWP